MARRDAPVPVHLPGGQRSPLRHIAIRLAFALCLVVFVALLTYSVAAAMSTPPTTR